MVDWLKAFETFVVGFGGVFITLIILYAGVVAFSKIVMSVTNMTAKKD
jgi:Na+-transporting methylmalonyl-CoA/oxaloacetate decarboxylase gamma subunit